ncbi:MAG: Calx-beta domain-containing protein, partial [Maribacter arcticus]|uniref:Calx-beta domain-containing protein n=1 Tax=Maribacter arcticus TaxID=561365 RepID=UPI0030039008
MKMKLYSSLLNPKIRSEFKKSLLVFGLVFLAVSFQNIFGQTVSIANDRDATEGSDISARYIVTVAPSSGSGTITVNYVVLPSSTASSGTDFAALSGNVDVTYSEIAGGSSFINVNTILQDLLVEGTETVVVEILSDAAYDLGTNNTAIVNILDDDTTTLSVTDISAVEGTNLVFNIVADKATLFDYTVTINFGEGTAIKGGIGFVYPDDYNGAQRTIPFLAGEVSKQLAVVTGNDIVIEDDETFIVTLTSASNANVIAGDTAIGTITNDDLGQVTVSADRPNTNEDGSGNNGRFRIELSEQNNTGSAIVVDYTLTGSAIQGAGQDYTISGNASIANGASSTNLNILPINDVLVEGDETVIITLNSVNSALYEIGTQNSDTVTIVDDDTAGFTVTESGGSTATSEPNGTDSFTVRLTSAPASNVVLNVVSSDIGEGTVSPGTLTFTPTNFATPQTVTVTGVNDAIVDGTQPYTITVSVNDASSNDAFDALADRIINVTNTDDDTAGFTVTESGGSTAT